jgi:hypothetical protein
MPFTFHNLKLPFVRVTTRTVTELPVAGQPIPKRPVTTARTWAWHVGPWSYNSRTGKKVVTFGKSVRWESKTAAQRSKRKKSGRYTAAEAEALARATERKDKQKAKAAQKAAERRQWQQKIAAGHVEGLRVPADVRSAPSTRPGVVRRPARSAGRSAEVVHRETPAAAAARAERQAEALKDARVDAQAIDRMRAAGETELRIAKFMESARVFRKVTETDRRHNASAPTAAADGPPAPAGAPVEAGLCGAATQDGTPCRNAKGCPHHKNSNRQHPARRRRS